MRIKKRSLAQRHYFTADKPFMFFILSKSAGMSYFTGRVSELTEEPQHDEL